MTKRYSYEEVEKAFNDKGYVLLETEYKRNSDKLNYVCDKHKDKINQIRFKDLLKGHGCPHCAGLAKHDISYVRSEFEKRGYILISEKYESALKKLDYKCNKHPEEIQSITLNKLKMGRGCKKCGIESRIEKTKGENGCNWKGGVMTLRRKLRSSTFLQEWRNKYISESESICFITGEKIKNLDVHHLKSFTSMIDESLKKCGLPFKKKVGDYSQSEIEEIVNAFKGIHNDCKGFVMRKDLHVALHSKYGKDVSYNELLEFKNNYNNSRGGENN